MRLRAAPTNVRSWDSSGLNTDNRLWAVHDPNRSSAGQFCYDAQRCLLVGFLVSSPNVLRTIVWWHIAQIRQSSTRLTKATLEESFMAANWILGTQVAPG
jgi:hypothetical protein